MSFMYVRMVRTISRQRAEVTALHIQNSEVNYTSSIVLISKCATEQEHSHV